MDRVTRHSLLAVLEGGMRLCTRSLFTLSVYPIDHVDMNSLAK
jgi:hypothetical protein